jgi:hypothetical protein
MWEGAASRDSIAASSELRGNPMVTLPPFVLSTFMCFCNCASNYINGLAYAAKIKHCNRMFVYSLFL